MNRLKIRIDASVRTIALAASLLALAAWWPMAAGADVVKVAAVGDVMMGTENMLPADGGADSFKYCQERLKKNDVVFLNHEGTLTDRGKATKAFVAGRSYIFRTPPSYGRWLEEAGFNMASLANNHADDYGPEGKKQTIEVLKKHGIEYADHNGAVARMTVRDVKIAMAAFFICGRHSLNDIAGAKKTVAKLADASDIVIVSFHGGREGRDATRVGPDMEVFLGEHRGDLVKFSHAVVDSGADLVIGHGPHVPRAMERYKDRLIAYSLGNFCTGKGLSVKGVSGYAPLLLAEIASDGRLLGGRILSYVQGFDQPPKPDPQNRAVNTIHEMGRLDFPKTNAVAPDGRLAGVSK